MADYDVVLGIAPIWEGLKRLGCPDFDFTYAGLDVFSPGGGQVRIGAVGGWTRFIMPLFFSLTKPEALEDGGKGKKKIQHVGHLLLCVAELVENEPMTIQVRVFDSRWRTVTHEQVDESVKTIIRRSGWLGRISPGTHVVYRPHIWTPVPEQVGDNTCGLHVILNAWATMLGIPIHRNPLRRTPSQENETYATNQRFLDLGLEIVNLALEGFMDSATIQAFFNVFGYSVEQRFGDPARAVTTVNAVGMNQDKFCRTLQKRLILASRDQQRKFSDAAMAYLFEQGLSKDQAWRALSIADGDPNLAIQWHFGLDPPGELPEPEDALSPKTPNRTKPF